MTEDMERIVENRRVYGKKRRQERSNKRVENEETR